MIQIAIKVIIIKLLSLPIGIFYILILKKLKANFKTYPGLNELIHHIADGLQKGNDRKDLLLRDNQHNPQ